MDPIRDFFICSACQNKSFRPIFTFSIVFRRVNFSDELIYDRITEEAYECTRCGKAHSKGEVEEKLLEFKRIRRSGD